MDTQIGSLVMALGDLRSFEELVRYHESKVQNMVIGYLISGRLFFFGISQTSLSLKCKDWWVILALTPLCTVVYFLILLVAVTTLCRTQYQLDIIRMELMEVCQRIVVTQNQNDADLLPEVEAGESGDGFDFGFLEKMLMLDHFRIVRTKVYIFFTVCALLVFTAIELYVSKYLLCC